MKSRRFPSFRIGLALLIILLALPLDFVQGQFVLVDIVNVPIERLIKNLEEIAKDDPMYVQARYNIARLHSMAYAMKIDTAQVPKGRENERAWLDDIGFVPYTVTSTKDQNKLQVAREHLAKAIEQYEVVLNLRPDHRTAALGHAWCIEQSGDKARAIREYRQIIESAWAVEKEMKRAPLGWRSLTAEAASYLIPLLDENKDSEEISSLRDRIKRTDSIPRPVTPIVIPLRNGLTAVDLEDHSAKVAFDADGTGLKKSWTWITDDAGWLVYDPQGTGKIDSALQLFGGMTFWLFWENGYQALAALDDDRNSMLTGGELQGLAIWQDINGDGISGPGEVKPLKEWGIIGISCEYQQDVKHPDKIAYSPRGILFRDGSSRPTYDVILRENKVQFPDLHLATRRSDIKGKIGIGSGD